MAMRLPRAAKLIGRARCGVGYEQPSELHGCLNSRFAGRRRETWCGVTSSSWSACPLHERGVWRSVPIDGDIETKKSRRTLALDPVDWTPRELRHSFVSVLSDAGLPGEEISHLVGHRGATITGLVYRHQLRPVVQTGAAIMDRLFSRRDKDA